MDNGQWEPLKKTKSNPIKRLFYNIYSLYFQSTVTHTGLSHQQVFKYINWNFWVFALHITGSKT